MILNNIGKCVSQYQSNQRQRRFAKKLTLLRLQGNILLLSIHPEEDEERCERQRGTHVEFFLPPVSIQDGV